MMCFYSCRLGTADFILVAEQKMTDDKWIDGRNVLETKDAGETTSFQKSFEVVALMITLPCHL